MNMRVLTSVAVAAALACSLSACQKKAAEANAGNTAEASRHLDALKSGVQQDKQKAAQGQLTAARGKYVSSEATLSYSEIHSPINGVVTDRPLFPGDTATGGEPVVTVMLPDED